MCLSPVESVPPVEAATEGPGPATRHVGLLLGAQVPLAHGIGGVAVGPEDLGQEAVLTGRPAPVPGEPGGQVGDAAHAAAMVVPPREQTGAGRGAEGRRVEVGEPDAVGGQAVDDGGVDVGPVAAELGEPHVVEHDEQHIGRAVGRRGLRWPPRFRGAPVVTDRPAELDPGHEGTSGVVGTVERIPPRADVAARYRHRCPLCGHRHQAASVGSERQRPKPPVAVTVEPRRPPDA